MMFIVEEINIKDEPDTNDLDLEHGIDLDLGSSSHCPDWSLYPHIECTVVLEGADSFNAEEEVQEDLDEGSETEIETRSVYNGNVDKSCGVYQKLKSLVDILKNCEKTENCEQCEIYIQQLQQHILTHNTMDVKIPHGDVPKKSEDELVPSRSIPSESERESTSRHKNPSTIKKESIPKRGKSKPHKCCQCQMTFLTFYDLTQHKAIHKEKRQVTHGNPILTSASTNEQVLSTGYQKQEFKCDVCLKRFSRSDTLTLHKKTHTGEKPYVCDVCGKGFCRSFLLIGHKLTHTGEKPLKCDLCGICFRHQSNLNRHKIVHTGEKRHKCDVCGKGFAQNYTLAQHKLLHTGEKRHECEVCGKRFTRHAYLESHKSVHTGEKPYICDVCGKSYAHTTSLNKHKRTHTG